MSIRQEQLFLIQARPDLSCDQLRSTLQNINSRLSNLQQCIPNPQHWRDKITKETAVPRLDLHKIQAQKENLMPQKKVTATFGEKHQESIEKCEEIKPQIRMVQQTPQRIRSCSMNGSQQVLRSQNNHQIQFKVTNASRLQNSIENQYYQSLHQSNEKTLNQSFTGSQQIYSTDQNMLVQPTLQQKPIIFDQNQQLGNTRNNSLLSTPVKQVAHVSQGQTPLRRGNSTTQQKALHHHYYGGAQQSQLSSQDLISILQSHQQQLGLQQSQQIYQIPPNNMTQFKVPHSRPSSNLRNAYCSVQHGNSFIRY